LNKAGATLGRQAGSIICPTCLPARQVLPLFYLFAQQAYNMDCTPKPGKPALWQHRAPRACLLGRARAQRAADVQDGAELRRAQRALALALAERARVEAVPAQEVHRRQLQRRAAQRAAAVLEHARLRARRAGAPTGRGLVVSRGAQAPENAVVLVSLSSAVGPSAPEGANRAASSDVASTAHLGLGRGRASACSSGGLRGPHACSAGPEARRAAPSAPQPRPPRRPAHQGQPTRAGTATPGTATPGADE